MITYKDEKFEAERRMISANMTAEKERLRLAEQTRREVETEAKRRAAEAEAKRRAAEAEAKRHAAEVEQ